MNKSAPSITRLRSRDAARAVGTAAVATAVDPTAAGTGASSVGSGPSPGGTLVPDMPVR